MHDPMKEALNRRRGKGVDMTILLSGLPEGVQVNSAEIKNADDPTSDLAPKGDDMAEESQESPEVEQHEQAEPEAGEENHGEAMDQEMTKDISDFDKNDLMNRKPRSLGDRVKQAAFGRMSKK